MREKCEKHQLTSCGICAAAAAKGTVPQPIVVGPPPVSISGGPPENIERLSVRDRLPQTVEEANTDYDKILAEVNAMKGDKANERESTVEEPTRSRVNTSFATLPIDDSHASQVVRAAAKYAEAARVWSVWVADAEKVKRTMIEVEAKLNAATEARIEAEDALKKLMVGI